jgi:hypothetical protein
MNGAIKQQSLRAASALCRGFRQHDRRDRDAAIEAFATVDRIQFSHLSETAARAAASCYVRALWEKDAIEDGHRSADGSLDLAALSEADWTNVRAAFAERARIVGMDPAYALLSTESWRRHKVGGDYWTPIAKAQLHELRAATGDGGYPGKPRHGHSGFGPEAFRYVVGVELHDYRSSSAWEEARDVMVPYYRRILSEHGGGSDE